MIKYFCDRCKRDCTDKYHELFIKVITEKKSEQNMPPAILCPNCFGQLQQFINGSDSHQEIWPRFP